MIECEKCKLWDRAAKESRKAGGMCGECFDSGYVHFKPKYEPDEYSCMNHQMHITKFKD